MSKKDIAGIVRRLTEPIAVGLGLELYDVKFVKEGPDWYVRIFIDKPGGVTIDDCEAVSRAAESVLDEKDPIDQSYILEVSSPGIDRELIKDADFLRYMGEIIDIKLYKAQYGKKTFRGKLAAMQNNVITISDDDLGELSFSRADVAICRLAVLF